MKLTRFRLVPLLLACPLGVAHAGTHFVDASAGGAATGATWGDAFVDLQDALGVAQPGDEIWVAAGVYVPSTTDASVSFVLQDGVGMYGGFAGGETSLAQRDHALNVTTLSGDIGQDDEVGSGIAWYSTWNIHTSNAGHVVVASGVGAGTVLDGFLIEGGGTGPTGTVAGAELMLGSGVFCNTGAPTLRNLTFLHNESAWGPGGGAYFQDSNALVEDCSFLENYAYLNNGGGMYVGGSGKVTIRNSLFARNVAAGGITNASGGGLYLRTDTQAEVVGCRFEDNYARQPYAQSATTTYGGGLAAFTEGVLVQDCSFERNRAQYGGGMFTWGDSVVVNTVFLDNEAYVVPNPPINDIGGYGAGVMINSYFTPKELRLINCTVAYNSAKKYAGAYTWNEASLAIENSIFWGNTASNPEISGGWKAQLAGDFDLAYTCVEDLYAPHAPGEDPLDPSKLPGCTDQDPRFVVAGAAGDLHLAADSPCIDAGRNDLVASIALLDNGGGGRNQDDPAIDTGAGQAPVVDMGAHERGSQSLVADKAGIDATTGGAQTMRLDLGPSHAGDLYLILGSVTGTVPGVSLGSLLLPLHADTYTNKTFASANTGPFVGTLGFAALCLVALDQRGPAHLRAGLDSLGQDPFGHATWRDGVEAGQRIDLTADLRVARPTGLLRGEAVGLM